MLEGLICFVAKLAFVFLERAKVNGVLKWTGLHVLFRRPGRVVDHRMADVAIVRNDFAAVADVLAVVTAEATREVKMANVVWMGLPVSLHLRKKVSLKDALNFGDRGFDHRLLLRVHVFVVRLVELV